VPLATQPLDDADVHAHVGEEADASAAPPSSEAVAPRGPVSNRCATTVNVHHWIHRRSSGRGR
jgi:hypothetical protein